MKYNLILLFSILGFSIGMNAQEIISYKGGKQYMATPAFNFFCENYAYDPNLKVQIAKTEKGGLIKLLVRVSADKLQIGGRLYIILENGNYIYCKDKIFSEYKNGESIAYYTLSTTEMAKLKSKTIENIRFRIIGKTTAFSSDSGYFTATNKIQLLDPFDKSSNKFDTKSTIKAILK